MNFKAPATFAERLALEAAQAEANAKEMYPNGKPKSDKCPWDVAQVRKSAPDVVVADYDVIEFNM